MKRRAWSLLLLVLLSVQLAAPAGADTPSGSPAPIVSTEANVAQNPWLMWAVRAGGQAVLGWVTSQVVDWAADRSGVTEALYKALDNLARIESDPRVPASIRTELRTIQRDFQTYRGILERNSLSDAQTRAQLRALRQDFTQYMRQTDARLAQLDERITLVEREQRRHLKMIVDLQGRVQRLENRLVDAEGNITDLQGQMIVLRGRVDEHDIILRPDPDRFLRHEAYLAGSLLYANSPELGGEAAIGGEITAQYNFDQYFGIFGGLAYMPLTAADVDSVADGASVTWDNINLHLGATASLLNPRSPVSLQLGAGGGIASSRLMFYDQGVERTSENGEELGTSSNVYMLVKAEIGIAPPAYTFEPIATFGYMTFMEDVAYAGSGVSSNMGRSVWFMSLGLRFRQYLRGSSERRNLPAGLGALRR